MDHRLGGFYSYRLEIERHGVKLGTRVRSLGVEEADERIAAALGLLSRTSVVALRRDRLADDEPIVTETSYLPAARSPDLEHVDFVQRRLDDVLTSMYGVRPLRARETFEPVLMNEDDALALGGAVGSPALLVKRATYDAEGRVIEFCQRTVRADRFRYSVELGQV
jgi:GntR family transcriptional regulator